MRKLATIQKIKNLDVIPNADAIEKATILGWEVVVKRGEFHVGDYAVFCEIDSILPDLPEFEFLRQSKFRIRTIRLRGQISQGIAFPVSILNNKRFKLEEDFDVTAIIGITKYEPYQNEIKSGGQKNKYVFPNWFPVWLRKLLVKKFPHIARFICSILPHTIKAKTWPSFFPKTDETRIQVLQHVLTYYSGTKCYITEKVDGSSISIYYKDGKIGVCSRNLDLDYDKGNRFWSTVENLNIPKKLKEYGQEIVLQGELLGEGVQGNKYGLSGNIIQFYNVWDIKKQEYYDYLPFIHLIEHLCLETVTILHVDCELIDSIPDLVYLSTGHASLNPRIPREGIVIRPMIEIRDLLFKDKLPGGRISFKAVNPEFLLKYPE